MAKYDAFGREIGENTLSGLGGTTPRSEVAEAEPPEASKPPPKFVKPRARRRSGRGLVLVIVVIAIAVQAFATAGEDEAGVVAVPSAAPAPAQPVRGADPAAARSLLLPAHLEKALRALREAELGRPINLRVEPARLDVQMLTADRRITVAQVSATLAVERLTTSGPGFGLESSTFALSAVRPAAPRRLIRAAARRLDRPPSEVNYLVFTRFGDDLQWGVYFRDGRHATGDPRGRLTRVF